MRPLHSVAPKVMNDPDKEPVLIVLNKSGKLVHAGKPETIDKKTLGEYVLKGYQLKTITIKKFRATNYKWFWDM